MVTLRRIVRVLPVGLAVAGACSLPMLGRPARAQEPRVIQLFNGRNWDGLYTFVPGEGKNKDSRKVFSIENGMIHVSGEKFAFVSTEKEYENYRLALDFKWGEKKWPPRANDKRDAGVLYHCVNDDKVWNKSLEFQIQEGDCGDMWLTGDNTGAPSITVLGKKYTGGRVVKWADYEKPNGEWNHVEVVARGPRFEHWMNGHLNMRGSDASLTKGRINFQSEGAEIYYRNITLESLQ
jgi:hypothetical protein